MKKVLFAFVSCLLAWELSGQEINVRGTVSDESGEPLAGAAVILQGGGKGTVTDYDGNYSISAPADASLVISFLGYLEQTVPVSGRTQINVALQPDSEMMDEVVVVGYGVQKSKDLTAPIVTVKGEEISRQVSSNAMSALQGKIAGVQVINSGAPGAGPSVKIRGIGSIGEYSNPLFVVDGAFVDNLDFVSANDIEEVTVLKDASAAAIYGVRAANGVIIVTTRKGRSGNVNICYDGYVGIQVPVNVMKLAGKEEYIELLNDANKNITGYVPKNAADYPGNTDWYASLLRNALTHSHSVDVSGATEHTNYSVGLGYFKQDGIMKCDNSFNRLNFRAKLEQDVNSWLKLGVTTLVSKYNARTPDTGAYFQAFVNPPVYNIFNVNNTDAYPTLFDSPQLYGFGNSYGNPYARAALNDARESGLNLVFSAFAQLSFLQGKLKFKSMYNLDYQGYQSRQYTPEYFVGGSQGVKESSLNKTFGLKYKHVIDNTLTYADSRGAHSFSAMLGQSTRIETFSGLNGSGTDVPGYDEQAKYIGNGSSKNLYTTDLSPAPYRFNGISFFARGTYNYDDRYLATLTLRADGSSKYNRKWGFFPSVGFGWVLTGEEFMKSQNVVQNLKLRASWGLLGNDSVPANSTAILSASGVAASAVFGDQLVDGEGAQTVAQNFLRWEVVNEFDVGVDFSFLRGRLSGELDYYYRTTDNVVFYVPIATGGGTTELLSNNGKVNNRGFELGLGWSDTVGDDFSYNINLNLTTIHNEVLSLEGRDYIPGASVRGNFTTRTQVGYPIGSFWGYEIDGVYQNEKDALKDPVYQAIKDAGYFKYHDVDGNKKVDDADKTYLGSPVPKLLGGLDFGLKWKNLDFAISFQGQCGNKILNAKRMNRDVFPDGNYDMDFYRHAWRQDAKSGKYPSPEAYNSGFIQQANSFFVENGGYIRIQNVQLGYNVTGIPYIKNLRVYLSAQRPYTFFTYNGFTPEIGGSPIASGIDTSTYPMQAIYTLGLKLNF